MAHSPAQDPGWGCSTKPCSARWCREALEVSWGWWSLLDKTGHKNMCLQRAEPHLPVSVAGRGPTGERGPRAWGWHSPDGLQAALNGLWRDEAAGRVVDLVGQTEAHLQPAIDMEPHHARRAQAAERGPPASHTRPHLAHPPECTSARPTSTLQGGFPDKKASYPIPQ